MPIPLWGWGIAGAASSLLSYLLRRSSKIESASEDNEKAGSDNEDEATEVVKLAILGANRVGKSGLHKAVKEDHQITGFRVLQDVDGGTHSYDEWKAVVDDADAVLYLLRSRDTAGGREPSSERIKRDVELIVSWLSDGEKRKSRYPLFFVATHCDEEFPDLSEISRRETFKKEIRGRKLMSWIKRRCKGVGYDLVIGSLSAPDDVRELVSDLFDATTEKRRG